MFGVHISLTCYISPGKKKTGVKHQSQHFKVDLLGGYQQVQDVAAEFITGVQTAVELTTEEVQ